MSVPSFAFLTLVALVGAVLAISAAPQWRRGILLVANVAFFCSFAQGKGLAQQAASLAPFVAFLICGFIAMRVVEKHRNRLLFFAILALVVIGFCWLKRYAFFPQATLLSSVYTAVGLSYAFFRVVGLLVDAYQGVLPARVGVAGYVNYALNFTSFVSGPVELYKPFWQDEVARPEPLDRSVAAAALERIVLGFFKVTILSPMLASLQQHSVDLAGAQSALAAQAVDAALVFAVFPIYLYVNFSGYTDVVIGAARFLRFELPENFNKPFLSRGYLEFWTRWHMSLAHWFKTYVYSPLLIGLMRRFTSREIEPLLGVVAYFVTFFLVGLWHGQTAMFLILGFLMGLGTSGNKLFQLMMIRARGRAAHKTLCDNPLYASLSAGLTFLWLATTLVFFWASADELVRLARAFGPESIAIAILGVWVAFSAVYWVWTSVSAASAGWRRTVETAGAAYLRPVWYAALAMVVVSVAVVLNAPAPHIVYKAF